MLRAVCPRARGETQTLLGWELPPLVEKWLHHPRAPHNLWQPVRGRRHLLRRAGVEQGLAPSVPIRLGEETQEPGGNALLPADLQF